MVYGVVAEGYQGGNVTAAGPAVPLSDVPDGTMAVLCRANYRGGSTSLLR